MKMDEPYVILKFAVSIDGFLSSKNDRSIILSSKNDLEARNKIRTECDGILIGGNTLVEDRPNLGFHGVESDRNLIPVIILNKLLSRNKIVLEKSLANIASKEVWLITDDKNRLYKTITKFDKIRDKLVKWIVCKKSGKKNISIKKIFKILKYEGLNKVLVEGGGSVLGQVLELKIFNELHISYSNIFLGHDGRLNLSNINKSNFNFLEIISGLNLKKVSDYNGTVCLSYVR